MNKEKIAKLKDRILNEVPISEVIGSRVEVRGRKALCPFHDDKTIGSFSFNDARGYYKCFSCGQGGDAITFIQKFDNVTFTQAVLLIAVEFSLITKQEYQQLSSKAYDKSQKVARVNTIIKSKDIFVHDEETLSVVYSLMINGAALYNEPRLSNEHMAHLTGRGITKADIDEIGYFTFPKSPSYLKAIISKLKQRGLTEQSLIGVPGFYWDNQSGTIVMSRQSGIGIPIRNVQGQIVAIQIRSDKNTSPRYTWFSSSFVYDAKYQPRFTGGCSPSTSNEPPVDIHIPDELKHDTVFVTEGHFKALYLMRRYNCIAISVQGVGNYQGVVSAIEELKWIYPKEKTERIVIAYDADLVVNKHVAKHSIELGKLLKSICQKRVGYMLWDMSKGKGIDDYLKGCTSPQFTILEFSKFAWGITKFLSVTEALPIEEKICFFNNNLLNKPHS